MLTTCRNSLLKLAALPVRSQHFSTTAVRSNQEKGPLDGDNAAVSNSPFEGILNVLGRSKAEGENGQTQQTEGLSSLLNESAKKKQTRGLDVSAFDMSFLASSLSQVSQALHQLHINATPNNTIITLTRPNGSPLVTTSGGSAGFKKAARSGYEAAHQAALQLLEKKQARNLNVKNLHVILKGFGPGREAAYRALIAGESWNVRRITDATPVPFGGCRPKKARRL